MQKKGEITRQFIHASGILFIALESIFTLPYLIIISLSAALIGELIYQIDKRRPIFFFSDILRSCRRDKNERGFIHFFLALTLTLSLFGFDLSIANAALIILVLGDSLSTVIGTRYGKHPLPWNPRKSWEGSTAFFVIAFLGAATQVPLLAALVGALVGAVTEAYSPVDDNLTIPIAAGAAITLILFFL